MPQFQKYGVIFYRVTTNHRHLFAMFFRTNQFYLQEFYKMIVNKQRPVMIYHYEYSAKNITFLFSMVFFL